MIGGIFTSFLLELLVYPAIYQLWKWNFDLKKSLKSATLGVRSLPWPAFKWVDSRYPVVYP